MLPTTAERKITSQPTSYGAGFFDALEGIKQMMQEMGAYPDFAEYYLHGVETRLMAGFPPARVRQVVLERVMRIEDVVNNRGRENPEAVERYIRRDMQLMEATRRRIAARTTTPLSS